MNTFKLHNARINETVEIQAIDSIKAKFIAAKQFLNVYPDIKGSPNSVSLVYTGLGWYTN